MEPQPPRSIRMPPRLTARVVVQGTASGILMGGNLNLNGRAIGRVCLNFADAILFLEAVDTEIGQINGVLTQLRRAGCLDGLKGSQSGSSFARPSPSRGS